MNYFEVEADNVACADRWFLSSPLDEKGQEILGERFRMAEAYRGPVPVWLPIYASGRQVAFHLASLDMPVVTGDVVRIVQSLAPGEAEFFDVTVGPDRMKGYHIMNVLHAEPCFDTVRSRVMWWKEEDSRPDKVGKPRMVMDLKIDTAKTAGHHILRVKDWRIALLVSETLRDELLRKVVDLGVIFRPVT